MPKKKPLKGKPTVNKELEGFEIEINELGEIKSNFSVDRINSFLDREVDDKKLSDRPDHSDRSDQPHSKSDTSGKEESEPTEKSGE